MSRNGIAAKGLKAEDWPYTIALRRFKHFGGKFIDLATRYGYEMDYEDQFLYPEFLEWCAQTFKARWAFIQVDDADLKSSFNFTAVIVVESLVDYMMFKFVWGDT